MIISRTPLRISFAGGGTDLRAFYSRESGCVLSTAINKFVYVLVNPRFAKGIHLKYSKNEEVDHFEDVQHPIIREAMRLTGVERGIELACIADVPSEGSGLGSSSSFTVGVLNALHAFRGETVGPEQLAQEACEIEISRLKEPIGKQDQYIAAYGGLRFFSFNPDESVTVQNVRTAPACQAALSKRLFLYYTGITRKASSILHEQQKNTAAASHPTNAHPAFSSLQKLKQLAVQLKSDLESSNPETLGAHLHSGWMEKKKLAQGVSNGTIDDLYSKAMESGAIGGKILGAGGGGFLLLYVPEENAKRVTHALKDYPRQAFEFEPTGSVVNRF